MSFNIFKCNACGDGPCCVTTEFDRPPDQCIYNKDTLPDDTPPAVWSDDITNEDECPVCGKSDTGEVEAEEKDDGDDKGD